MKLSKDVWIIGGCISIMIAIYPFRSRSGERDVAISTPALLRVKPSSISVVTKSEAPPESDIVSECDLLVRSSLVAQNSFDPEFGWKFIPGNPRSEVLRHYDATNSFGGTITSIYDCKYDNLLRKVVSLQTASPRGGKTLVADPEQKSSAQHKRHHHIS